MSRRIRLPNRRESETFGLEAQGLKFTCTASRFPDGRLAEVFLQSHKTHSMAGINAQDAAVVCSLALQHGVPLDVIRRAFDVKGRASGPLATALDMLAERDEQQ
jgi:hypothetical protein